MEGLVEMFIRDFPITPFVDGGAGAPPAVANTEPEPLIMAAHGKEAFGGGCKGGEL